MFGEPHHRAWYQALFDSSPDAILLSDPEGRVLATNPAAERLFGYTQAEICQLGRGVVVDADGLSMGRLFEQCEQDGFARSELGFTRKDGAKFIAEVTSNITRGEDGKPLVVMVIRDATDGLKLQRELAEAQRLAHIGSWYWDAVTDVTSGSDELLRIYGFDPATEGMPNFKEQRDICYPAEEWERINTAVQNTMRTGVGYELEVRAFRNKAPIWVTTRSEIVRDSQGRVIGLRGTVQDITDRKHAEIEKRKSEQRFRSIFSNNMVPMALWEKTGGLFEANDAFLAMFGYTRAELEAGLVRWSDMTPSEYHARDMRAIGEIEQKGFCSPYEKVFLHKDGHPVPILIGGGSFDGQGHAGVLFAIDLSESKAAEAVLRDGEARLRRMLLDVDAVGVLFFNYDGVLVDANDVFLRMSGYTRAEVTSGLMTWRTMTPAEWVADSEAQMRQFAKTRRIGPYEKEYLRKDGSRAWMLFAGRDMNDGTIIEYAVDISARKQAEQALRESETRYRTLFNSIDEGYCVIQVLFDDAGKPYDYVFEEINPVFEKQTGIKNAVGCSMREIAPDHEEHWFETYGRIALTGKPERFENIASALHRWYDVYAFRIGDPDERRVAILFNDITARKETEAALQESEQHFRALVQASSDVVYRMSADWTVMRHLVGREFIADTTEPSQTWLQKYIHPDDQPEVMVAIQRAVSTKSVFELAHRVLRLDGSLGWTFSRAIPILNEVGEVVEWFGMASDITARKQAERALRESEENFRGYFENVAVGTAMIDPEGHFLRVNERYCAITGYSREELLGGMGPFDLAHPDERKADSERFARYCDGETPLYDVEKRYLRKDGGMVWVHVSAGPVLDDNGEFRYSAGVIEDITARKQAEAALRESREKLALFMSNSPVSLAMFDTEMRYLAASFRWIETYKLGDREIIGHSHYEIFPEIGEEWKAVHRRALAGEVVRKDVDQFVRADGGVQWLRWEVRPWYGSDEKVGGIVIFTEDITPLMLAENQMRVTARIFDQAGEAIMVTGPDNIIQTVNAAFCDLSGYAASEVVGRSTTLFKSGRHSREFYKAMWRALGSNGFWQGEIWDRRKDGEVHPAWLTITRVDDEQGGVAHYVAVYSDITQLKDSQRKIEFLATHDILTELPNRYLFHDRLFHALAQMRRSKSRLALMFIDLDNFKTINDTLGHDIGDALLRQVSLRLRAAVRDIDTVARLGGDEFTTIMTDATSESVDEVAARILSSLNEPFSIEDRTLYVSASVGIAFYPEDGLNAADLIKSADAAMYRAKEHGRNRVEFFVPDLHERLLKRTKLESALHEALRHERLRLLFQPKVALPVGNRVVGAEALLRWHDPELGDIEPAELIPIAEESGQILEVDRAVRRLLVEQLAAWHRQGLQVPVIAFNVSPRCLREAAFAEELLALIAEHEVPSDRIQMEITEGALLERSSAVVGNLEKLAQAGIRVALDDFGIGYSSLNNLKHLPISELKIDKGFVDGLGQDKDDEAITNAVLALANALGLETVAEGVETTDQLAWLERAGCPVGQGFFFFRPLDAEEFAGLIKAKVGPEAVH